MKHETNNLKGSIVESVENVNTRLVIENDKRKKCPFGIINEFELHDYGKMCPNFWLGEN